MDFQSVFFRTDWKSILRQITANYGSYLRTIPKQIYYDVGNSTDEGYDIYKEIRMIKGRVCEFHAKDGKFMLGAGRVDFKKVREAMDEISTTAAGSRSRPPPPRTLSPTTRPTSRYLKPTSPSRRKRGHFCPQKANSWPSCNSN